MSDDEKVKAQCQTCKKSFGGTLTKLSSTEKCPKCGAGGDWWRPVETRMIQRSRMQAQVNLRPYSPPPPPGGRQWVPREQAPPSYLVLRLAVIGWVLAPVGLVTGPIGIFVALDDAKRARDGVKRQDVGTGLGIALCVLSMLTSLYACYVLWAIFVDNQPTSNFR